MFFLTFVLMGAAVWLLWNICKNTGDALDKQTAIQYELVTLEKKLEELSDKLSPSVSADDGGAASKKAEAPASVDVGLAGAETPSGMVNINRDSLKDIIQLPRIGKALAQRVIDGRPYASIEGVKAVQGISEDMFGEIKSYITVD